MIPIEVYAEKEHYGIEHDKVAATMEQLINDTVEELERVNLEPLKITVSIVDEGYATLAEMEGRDATDPCMAAAFRELIERTRT